MTSVNKKEISNNNVLKTNLFMNGDSLKLIKELPANSIDYIITSPPYNYSSTLNSQRDKNGKRKKDNMYDFFKDYMSSDEYCQWTIELFNEFDRVLKKGGIILYNFSFSAENPMLPQLMLASIHIATKFTKEGVIQWIKKKAMVSNSNVLPQKYSEDLYILMRKGEKKYAKTNRKVSSVSKNGRINYKQFPNVIYAANGTQIDNLNRATFSTDLINQLLDGFVSDNTVVLDPFMGTGTTAVSCLNAKRGIKFIGMELSSKQVAYSYKRVKEECGNDLLKTQKIIRKNKTLIEKREEQTSVVKSPTSAQRKFYKKLSYVMNLASRIYKNKVLYGLNKWHECIKYAWKLVKNEVFLTDILNTDKIGSNSGNTLTNLSNNIDELNFDLINENYLNKKQEMFNIFEKIDVVKQDWRTKIRFIKKHINTYEPRIAA